MVFSCKFFNLEQDGRGGNFMVMIYVTLVACNLYLLISFISHGWADVAPCPRSSSKGTYLFFPLLVKVSVVEFMLLFVS